MCQQMAVYIIIDNIQSTDVIQRGHEIDLGVRESHREGYKRWIAIPHLNRRQSNFNISNVIASAPSPG